MKILYQSVNCWTYLFSVFPLLLLTDSVWSQVFSAGFRGKHGGMSSMYFPSNNLPLLAAERKPDLPEHAEDSVVALRLTCVLRWLTAHSSRWVANHCQLCCSDWHFQVFYDTVHETPVGFWWVIPPESRKSIINEQDLLNSQRHFLSSLLSLRWSKNNLQVKSVL